MIKKIIFTVFIALLFISCPDSENERFIYNVVYEVLPFGMTVDNYSINYRDADGNTQALTGQTVPFEIIINKNYSDGIFQPYLQATRAALPDSESIIVTIYLEDYRLSFSRIPWSAEIQTNNSGGPLDITTTVYGPILPP